MDWMISLLPMVAIAAILTLFEAVARPAKTDWWLNIQAWVFGTFTGLSILPLFHALHLPSLIDGATLPFWVAFPVFLIVRDFAEFLYHRAQHSIPVLWRMHSLHHSDPEMSALTTNRHFWGEQVVKAATIWPLTTMIISQTDAMIAGFSVLSLYNYVIHANLRIDFGKWSWVLNAPAYHRRHHSKLVEHYNSNYAALFPIWDVIFGTYRRPDGWPPTGQATMPERFSDLVVWPALPGEPEEQPATASAA